MRARQIKRKVSTNVDKTLRIMQIETVSGVYMDRFYVKDRRKSYILSGIPKILRKRNDNCSRTYHSLPYAQTNNYDPIKT